MSENKICLDFTTSCVLLSMISEFLEDQSITVWFVIAFLSDCNCLSKASGSVDM